MNMNDPAGKVIDLIFGRWRSQILYTGVKQGVFDALANSPRSVASVATELDMDPGMLWSARAWWTTPYKAYRTTLDLA